MTEIERKALALLNEHSDYEVPDLDEAQYCTAIQALCRAIEQHEAFRQEVSDAVEVHKIWLPTEVAKRSTLLDRFIIAKPDPLVEALNEAGDTNPLSDDAFANAVRAAIEKRGGKIVWGEV